MGNEAFQSLTFFTQPMTHCKVHNTPHLVEVVRLELVAIPEEKAEECNQTKPGEVGATRLILAEELPLDP
jgi:hypothetical protein